LTNIPLYEIGSINDILDKTSDERLEKLKAFFDSFATCTSNVEQNTLYKTIIQSIIHFRVGDNIEVKINFL
jgi:hypothetical protein